MNRVLVDSDQHTHTHKHTCLLFLFPLGAWRNRSSLRNGAREYYSRAEGAGKDPRFPQLWKGLPAGPACAAAASLSQGRQTRIAFMHFGGPGEHQQSVDLAMSPPRFFQACANKFDRPAPRPISQRAEHTCIWLRRTCLPPESRSRLFGQFPGRSMRMHRGIRRDDHHAAAVAEPLALSFFPCQQLSPASSRPTRSRSGCEPRKKQKSVVQGTTCAWAAMSAGSFLDLPGSVPNSTDHSTMRCFCSPAHAIH